MKALSIEDAASRLEAFDGRSGAARMMLFNPASVPAEGRAALARSLGDELKRRLGALIQVAIDDEAVDARLASGKRLLPWIFSVNPTILATIDLSSSDQGGPRDMAAVEALVQLAELGGQGAKVAVVALRNPLDGVEADMVLDRAHVVEIGPGLVNLGAWRQVRQDAPDDPSSPKP